MLRNPMGLGAIRPLRRRVFDKADVPLPVKAQLCQAIAYSKTLYNAHIWPPLNKTTAKLFHAGVTKLQRVAAGMDKPSDEGRWHSDLQVQSALATLPPVDMLRTADLHQTSQEQSVH